jgi:hypothetical protein
MILPHGPTTFEVRGRGRGAALVSVNDHTYCYRPLDGDPLGIGAHESLGHRAAYEVVAESDYPDAIVQIARLAGARRSGEIIVSAARDWDFRARYEPIPHVSSHGALHREHMLVPLLTSRPPERTPLRTVDVMPSALVALGLPVPAGLDGESFVARARPGAALAPIASHLAPERPGGERGAESAVA